MTNIVAELTIQDLALENAELRDRLRSLEEDVAVYRELAQVGLHALATEKREHQRHREQHARLLEEYRRLREHRLAEAA